MNNPLPILWYALVTALAPAWAVELPPCDWIVTEPGEVAVTGGVELTPGVWAPTERGGTLEVECLTDLAIVNVASVAEDHAEPERTFRAFVLTRQATGVEVVRRGRWEVHDATGIVSAHDRLDKAIERATTLEIGGVECYIVPPERFEVEVTGGTIAREVLDE